MRASIAVSALAALSSVVSAGPIKTKRSDYGVAVYWGQENVERSFGDYCASGQGINIMILSFLSSFGGGQYPNGYLGDCSINSDGSFDQSACGALATDIQTCQNNGVLVFVSLGGGGASFAIDGTSDANGIAYSLWYSYGQEQSNNSSPRPFGSVKVDGFDFDIESNPNNQSEQYLGTMVNTLRGYFSQDTSKSYYISGAPQCVIPDANMGDAISQAQFDYLWIQFYNNNCAAADYTDPSGNNPQGNGKYNLGSWPGYLNGGSSQNAKLFVGLPASTSAASGSAGPYDYIPPSDLPSLISDSSSTQNFAGVMLYDAGQSDTIDVNGCNYAQNVASVFSTGASCS